jgi:hypothetical protein
MVFSSFTEFQEALPAMTDKRPSFPVSFEFSAEDDDDDDDE